MRAKPMAARAGMSPKTFYDLFADSEDCFLALFDRTLEGVAEIVRPVYESETGWTASIRAGLGTLLAYLDANSAMCDLLFVQALAAGPRVLERRTEVLDVLARAVDEGRRTKGRDRSSGPSPLTAESVVGAAFTVIHTRACQQQPGGLSGLLNQLMAMIVLPYRGQAAGRRELGRRLAVKRDEIFSSVRNPASPDGRPENISSRLTEASSGERAPVELPIRLTCRTVQVLQAVAENPGAGNRIVGEAAGVSDQGQISKLLHRLERHGLLQNTGMGRPTKATNAWQLTSRGEHVVLGIGEEVTRHAA